MVPHRTGFGDRFLQWWDGEGGSQDKYAHGERSRHDLRVISLSTPDKKKKTLKIVLKGSMTDQAFRRTLSTNHTAPDRGFFGVQQMATHRTGFGDRFLLFALRTSFCSADEIENFFSLP